jgi:ADP-ribose pyrophosphatase YjhB (NUDIX family)
LPGGGLEMGEGTIECLKREWREELDMEVTVLEHFYTTDFYQPSAYDDSQIISIYYLVAGEVPDLIINHVNNERTYWVDLGEVSAGTFTLPIDKHVGDLLRQRFI